MFRTLSQGKAVGIFLVLVTLVGIPVIAQAGILSKMSELLSGKATSAPAAVFLSAQNIALLEPSARPSMDANSIDTQIVDNSSLKADAGPLGSAAEVASSSANVTSDQISVYTVRPGDTLSGIADMFNVTINTILWSNDLKRGAAIRPGQQLVILPISGVQYTVKKGDTLVAVAKKYGADKDEIMSFNNLETERLAAGDVLIIPDGEAIPVVTGGSGSGSKPSQPSYSNYYVWPVAGGRKSQGLHGHNGIDIAAPAGTPILAAAGGTVILVREGGYNGGYGSYAVIKHPNGTQTLYAHALSLKVIQGQAVSKGQTIGLVGSTGRSTGNHLHFEVRGARNPF